MSNFEIAAKMSLYEWVDSLPEEFEHYEHSAKYEKAINRLFDKMRDGRYHRLTRTTARIILVAAILFIAATVAFASTVGRDFVLERYKTFASYFVTDGSDVKTVDDLVLDYIPEGFELVEEERTGKYHSLLYRNNSQSYLIEKNTSSYKLDFDSEKVIDEVSLNGITYVYYETGYNQCGIIWSSVDYLYCITGDIDKDEMLKIAENTR